MKGLLIHGNAPLALQVSVQRLKANFDSLSVGDYDAKTVSLGDILIEIATAPLFANQRLVILRDFAKLSVENLANVSSDDLTLVLVFSKLLPSQSELLQFAKTSKNWQVVTLDESKEESVFPFLNHLMLGQSQALIELDRLLPLYGSQYLLTMIFYGLRRLVLPLKSQSSYAQQVLLKQKQHISEAQVKEFYRLGIETDFKIKSGLLDEVIGLHLLVEGFLEV